MSLLPHLPFCRRSFIVSVAKKGGRERGREGGGEIGAALSEWGLGKHEIDRNETKERKRRTDDGRRRRKSFPRADGKVRRPRRERNMYVRTVSACVVLMVIFETNLH